MSLKDLFKLSENLNIITPGKSLDELGRDGESADYVVSYVDEKERFIPHVDFSSASNFARYGSAEQYYEDSIARIYKTYPYDGSLKEVTDWRNKSSYIDEYIFENQYPRTNGYVILSAGGWGTLAGGIVEGYGAPATSDYEFIQVKGGPNPDPDADTIIESFPGIHKGVANYYHEPTRRKSNLAINIDNGVSTEFWLKKDAFDTASTEKEVVFDLWNGEVSSSVTYGRLTIELTGAAAGSPFLVTMQSGTDGYFQQSIGATPTIETLTSWNHYAFTFISSSGGIETKFYLNGDLEQTLTAGTAINEVTGALIANIGALRTAPSGNVFFGTGVAEGHGKMSGSLDEFRYWTTKRTSKDIYRFWLAQVAGGTNTDVALTGTFTGKYNETHPVDLGVYYKFNEGITTNSSIDSIVLDYSGRISNGSWVGYVGTASRNVGSAMVESGVALKEFKDPIIYSSHPDVDALSDTLKSLGYSHDLRNNAGMYHTLPSWITEEDEGEEANVLKKLIQILGSYFDTLHLQIENLPTIKNVDFVNSKYKPYSFTPRLLNNMGFISPDIFTLATELETLRSRDEVRNFDQKLYDLKNHIYKNIYNNLSYIYKSKGTEKAFRNLFRCFGVDDELVKINLYADNTTYELRESYRSTAYRKKYVAFNHTDRLGATVYMSASSDVNSTLSYISGSDTADATRELFLPSTTEVEVIFPIKPSPPTAGYFSSGFVSSSLFGVHEAVDDPSDFTWAPNDNNNYQVYSVRDELESKNVKFVLVSSLAGVPTLETDFYEDVYENQKWNFAVRVYWDKINNGGSVKGGKVIDLVDESTDDATVYIGFYGVNSVLDQVVNEFHVSGAMTFAGAATDPSNTANKRLYIGAHRTNFTGSILERSDVKVSSARYWKSYLSNDVIKAHARDASNFGTEHPYRNTGLTKNSLSNIHVPAMESLALHWDFDTVSGSDASGDFIVQDYSSGSVATTSRYGWLGNIVKNQHAGRGQFFPVSDTDTISNEFLYSAKQRLPESINSDNMVNILSQDDEMFTRESRPISHFFAIEKSMYQTISEEMINFFATIVDFNNLIGEPVNRYRQEYKDMGKVRQLFYERVQNVPSLEKYINFYKWIDSAISKMILQLIPASANMSEKLRNTVESHVLERNKYWTKFPTIEFKQKDPEAGLRGVPELLYDWEHGYAPLSDSERDNCLWWKQRAERDNAVITSGDSVIDSQREEINDADEHRGEVPPNLSQEDGTSYAGSTYAIRRFSKPYKLNVDESLQIHGGANFHKSKKLEYASIATEIFGNLEPLPLLGVTASINYLFVTASNVDAFAVCDDVIVPNQKRKYTYSVQNSRESGSASGYEFGKGDLLLPFNIHSSSVTTGYAAEIAASSFGAAVGGMDFTNIHVDAYGSDNEVPMQTPFTEKFVGGRQHRHVALNRYDSTLSTTNNLQDWSTRTEAWYILLGDLGPALGIVGPTYTSTGSHDKDTPRATRMREEFAKRPVNIRNIQQTTGSPTKIGNYESNWNVVFTTSRTQNNPYFKENSGVPLPDRLTFGNYGRDMLPATTNAHTLVGVQPGTTVGNIFGAIPPYGQGNRFFDGAGSSATVFALPRRDLTGSNSVIVNRFSAPGGPEINSRGYLDIMAEEYSVHNALPFRNLSVRSSGSGEQGTIRMSIEGSTTITSARDREGLRTRLTRHCGQFGVDSQWGSTVASYHKVNRNPLKRIKEA